MMLIEKGKGTDGLLLKVYSNYYIKIILIIL